MRKRSLGLTVLALVAGGAATAPAQGLPTTQPKFIQIYREAIKAGRSAAHAKREPGWAGAHRQAGARPALSHGAFPDVAMMRFWEISTFRVKPGHEEEFAAAAKAYAAAAARSAPSASWRTYEGVGGG